MKKVVRDPFEAFPAIGDSRHRVARIATRLAQLALTQTPLLHQTYLPPSRLSKPCFDEGDRPSFPSCRLSRFSPVTLLS